MTSLFFVPNVCSPLVAGALSHTYGAGATLTGFLAVAALGHLVFAMGAQHTVSFLADATSSLSDAKSSLGDAKSSLGDDKSSLGDAESSLGDAKRSGGAAAAAGAHAVRRIVRSDRHHDHSAHQPLLPG
jgi:type IV secretory pathway TrbL component